MKKNFFSPILLLLLFGQGMILLVFSADDCTDPACNSCPFALDQCKSCYNGHEGVFDLECEPCTIFGCLLCSGTNCNQCFSGFTKNGKQCVFCGLHCASCESSEKCSKCDSGYYLNEGRCSACDSNCDACSGPGQCTTCASGYYSNGGICSACDSGCKTCSGPGPAQCTECASGYYSNAGKCTACDSGCETCSGPGKCKTCKGDYLLEGDACTFCGEGRYAEFDYCADCYSKNCLECPGNGCTKCADGYTLLNYQCGKCVDDNCKTCAGFFYKGKCIGCAAGYYPDPSTHLCEKCPDGTNSLDNNDSLEGCQTCSDDNCESCPTSLGVCASCKPGYWESSGSCKACDDPHCATCDDNGKCSDCGSGYFLSGSTCTACAPEGCGLCGGSTPADCQECKASYYFESDPVACISCGPGKYAPPGSKDIGDCVKCAGADEGCTSCSGADEGMCTSCDANFYLDTKENKCKACEQGKFSVAGSTQCSDCADENCNVCSGPGINKCSKCDIDTYLDSKTKTCTDCPNGHFSPAGSDAVDQCLKCDLANCLACSAEGTTVCKKCEVGYGLSSGACGECDDDNCESCSSPDAGKCDICKIGYTLLDSKICGNSETKIVVQLSSTIRYEMTMEEYKRRGGKAYWIATAGLFLGIPTSQIRITSEKEGSVILEIAIAAPDSGTLEEQQKKLVEIKAALTQAVKNGDLNVYPGAVILNYESNIVRATAVESCPAGQYPDPIANVCTECPAGCPNCATETCDNDEDKKGAKVGAILGGVLGGVALIMVISVIAYKKGYFASLQKAKTPTSAKYDLAKSNPTSPDSQKTPHAEA